MDYITPAKPTVSLESLAREINRHHAVSRQAAKNAVGQALEAGDKLLAAKKLCSHGQWQKWLADNVEFSNRTARAYMRLSASRTALESKTAETAVLDSTIDGALKFLSAPKPKPTFSEPDLSGGRVFVAFGAGGHICQLESSVEHPGHFYATKYHIESGEVLESMRPFKRKIVAIGTAMKSLGFEQSTDWIECSRDEAPIKSAPEWAKAKAWLAVQRGESWADSLEKEIVASLKPLADTIRKQLRKFEECEDNERRLLIEARDILGERFGEWAALECGLEKKAIEQLLGSEDGGDE